MKPVNHNKSSQHNSLLQKNLAVLLADDNSVNRFLGKKILSQLGISEVEVASDGNTALEMIKAKHKKQNKETTVRKVVRYFFWILVCILAVLITLLTTLLPSINIKH